MKSGNNKIILSITIHTFRSGEIASDHTGPRWAVTDCTGSPDDILYRSSVPALVPTTTYQRALVKVNIS